MVLARKIRKSLSKTFGVHGLLSGKKIKDESDRVEEKEDSLRPISVDDSYLSRNNHHQDVRSAERPQTVPNRKAPPPPPPSERALRKKRQEEVEEVKISKTAPPVSYVAKDLANRDELVVPVSETIATSQKEWPQYPAPPPSQNKKHSDFLKIQAKIKATNDAIAESLRDAPEEDQPFATIDADDEDDDDAEERKIDLPKTVTRATSPFDQSTTIPVQQVIYQSSIKEDHPVNSSVTQGDNIKSTVEDSRFVNNTAVQHEDVKEEPSFSQVKPIVEESPSNLACFMNGNALQHEDVKEEPIISQVKPTVEESPSNLARFVNNTAVQHEDVKVEEPTLTQVERYGSQEVKESLPSSGLAPSTMRNLQRWASKEKIRKSSEDMSSKKPVLSRWQPQKDQKKSVDMTELLQIHGPDASKPVLQKYKPEEQSLQTEAAVSSRQYVTPSKEPILVEPIPKSCIQQSKKATTPPPSKSRQSGLAAAAEKSHKAILENVKYKQSTSNHPSKSKSVLDKYNSATLTDDKDVIPEVSQTSSKNKPVLEKYQAPLLADAQADVAASRPEPVKNKPVLEKYQAPLLADAPVDVVTSRPEPAKNKTVLDKYQAPLLADAQADIVTSRPEPAMNLLDKCEPPSPTYDDREVSFYPKAESAKGKSVIEKYQPAPIHDFQSKYTHPPSSKSVLEKYQPAAPADVTPSDISRSSISRSVVEKYRPTNNGEMSPDTLRASSNTKSILEKHQLVSNDDFDITHDLTRGPSHSKAVLQKYQPTNSNDDDQVTRDVSRSRNNSKSVLDKYQPAGNDDFGIIPDMGRGSSKSKNVLDKYQPESVSEDVIEAQRPIPEKSVLDKYHPESVSEDIIKQQRLAPGKSVLDKYQPETPMTNTSQGRSPLTQSSPDDGFIIESQGGKSQRYESPPQHQYQPTPQPRRAPRESVDEGFIIDQPGGSSRRYRPSTHRAGRESVDEGFIVDQPGGAAQRYESTTMTPIQLVTAAEARARSINRQSLSPKERNFSAWPPPSTSNQRPLSPDNSRRHSMRNTRRMSRVSMGDDDEIPVPPAVEAVLFAAEMGDVEGVKMMIESHGVSIDAADPNDGYTSLTMAAESGCIEVVHYLIQNGANLHKKDILGRTALYAAATAGQIQIVTLLIENGADPTILDVDKRSIFWATCALQQCKAAEALLDAAKAKGFVIDINALDPSGFSAMEFAAAQGYANILDMLRRRGARERRTSRLDIRT